MPLRSTALFPTPAASRPVPRSCRHSSGGLWASAPWLIGWIDEMAARKRSATHFKRNGAIGRFLSREHLCVDSNPSVPTSAIFVARR